MSDSGCCIRVPPMAPSPREHWRLSPTLPRAPSSDGINSNTSRAASLLADSHFWGQLEAKPTPRAPSSTYGGGQSLVPPGNGVFSVHPSPEQPAGLGCRETPASQACPHLLNPEPREEMWERVPRALCTSGTATGPNREPGPPEGVGSRSQGEVRLPGSQGSPAGSGHTPSAGSSRLPPPRTPAAEMKFGSGAICPFSSGMEKATLRVVSHPAAGFWDAGHRCMDQPENKWLAEVERSFFAWKVDVPAEVRWLWWFMDFGGGLHPKQDLFCISPGHVSPPSPFRTREPKAVSVHAKEHCGLWVGFSRLGRTGNQQEDQIRASGRDKMTSHHVRAPTQECQVGPGQGSLLARR